MSNAPLTIPRSEDGIDYATELARQPRSVLTVEYDDAGRITAFGGMPEEDVLNTLRFTQRKIMRGEGKPETHYVEFVGDARAPVLRVRPAFTEGFDKTEVSPREAATLRDVPAAKVSFKGPVKGTHQHPGGDLVVGWTVPGTYTVCIEAFPALPASFEIKVGATS